MSFRANFQAKNVNFRHFFGEGPKLDLRHETPNPDAKMAIMDNTPKPQRLSDKTSKPQANSGTLSLIELCNPSPLRPRVSHFSPRLLPPLRLRVSSFDAPGGTLQILEALKLKYHLRPGVSRSAGRFFLSSRVSDFCAPRKSSNPQPLNYDKPWGFEFDDQNDIRAAL